MVTEASEAHLQVRKEEIEGYLIFLKACISKNAKLVYQGGELVLSLDVTHALKSNAYLLLYSAVESTMVQLMEEVHDALEAAKNLELDRLHPALCLHILRNLKEVSTDFSENDLPTPIGKSMLTLWLKDYKKKIQPNKAHPLFNGNVDSKIIVKIAQQYGFCPQDDSTIRHPSLLTAKQRRNRLAHGSTSFTDMGKDLSYEQIEQDAEDILSTLKHLIATVNQYLASQAFLQPPSSTPG